jgi:hypothetical protein
MSDIEKPAARNTSIAVSRRILYASTPNRWSFSSRFDFKGDAVLDAKTGERKLARHAWEAN